MAPKTVKEIVSGIGSMKEAAAKFGVRYQSVQKWIRRGKIPYRRALQLERITEGRIRIEDIRGMIS